MSDDDKQLIVTTRVGKLQGTRLTNFEGDEYYVFKGVPYAKPPIGELRFKDPEPVEPWTDIREAINHGPNCAQPDIITTYPIGSDDCLYLNIYSKNNKVDKKLPVIFWIHGGGFVYGCGDETFHSPDYFMRKDVVLVTINYRVGVLGFLNLNVESATGNQGLKDQVMALKWVRDNISNFGGDPENVTISGMSAGSASVHYLCISPLAKGLFHKAILHSGVALNPWAFHLEPEKRAYQLCQLLGHEGKDPKSAVEFLKTVDILKLIEAQEKLRTKDEKIKFMFTFGPSIDSKSVNPFISEHPEEMAKKGIDVPVIIGYTSREGIILLLELGKAHSRFNKEFEHLLHPNALEYMKRLYDLSPENLKKVYLQNEEINDSNVEKLIDMLGDLHFVEGIHRVVKTQIENDSLSTYLYQFSYDKDVSFFKTLARTKMSGACHVDDLIFIFTMQPFPTMKQQFVIPKKSWYQMAKWYLMTIPLSYLIKYGRLSIPKEGTDRHRISEQMIDMWVNFAVTGKPTSESSELVPVDWMPVDDSEQLRYLNICEVLSMEETQNLELKYTANQDSEQDSNNSST